MIAIDRTWSVPTVQFATLQHEVEVELAKAMLRHRRMIECLQWINPTPHSESCEVEAPNYLVTEGGLSFQDAALQCLQGGCRESLEEISERAARRAAREKKVVAFHVLYKDIPLRNTHHERKTA